MTELERFTASIRTQFEEAGQRLEALVSGLSRGSAFPDQYARYVAPPVRHLFLSGGKLLRPLLLLLSARAVGEITPRSSAALVRAAAAVELLHTASLAHDDMVDLSAERRGVPSLHRAFGTSTAILVGDLFYARFFQELATLPGVSPALRVRVLDSFLEVTARMCEGEILEEQIRSDGAAPSFEEYLHITDTKTASLLAACCRAGALLNFAADPVAEALAGYGRSLGLLFQIADDLADGDAAYGDRARLEQKAEQCRSSAGAFLRHLPRNAATATLAEIPGHILSPTRF
jgi:octaprenyl-diphosphate synthase